MDIETRLSESIENNSGSIANVENNLINNETNESLNNINLKDSSSMEVDEKINNINTDIKIDTQIVKSSSDEEADIIIPSAITPMNKNTIISNDEDEILTLDNKPISSLNMNDAIVALQNAENELIILKTKKDKAISSRMKAETFVLKSKKKELNIIEHYNKCEDLINNLKLKVGDKYTSIVKSTKANKLKRERNEFDTSSEDESDNEEKPLFVIDKAPAPVKPVTKKVKLNPSEVPANKKNSGSNSVILKNLAYSATKEKIKEFFSPCGKIMYIPSIYSLNLILEISI